MDISVLLEMTEIVRRLNAIVLPQPLVQRHIGASTKHRSAPLNCPTSSCITSLRGRTQTPLILLNGRVDDFIRREQSDGATFSDADRLADAQVDLMAHGTSAGALGRGDDSF